MALKISRIAQAKRRASRTIMKRLKAEDRVLKSEEDQGYASVLPSARAKKRPQRPGDMPNKSKARTA
jgi:hypothetical protein